jgi:predicted phosphodiesterase
MKNPRVPILISLPSDAESVQIYIASDPHNGSAQFSEKKWKAFEEAIMQPSTYVIFVGDQMEYATRSSKSDVYTQTLSPSAQKRWWIEHLRPLAEDNKILCIVDGNHEYNRASKDSDDFPLYDIALALGIEDRYRSEGAFVDIGVGDGGHGKGKQTHYVFRVQHQAKNNVNYGTVDGFEGIDVFVSGHTHKPMDKPAGRLVYDPKNKYVAQRDIENIVSGHFLRFGGYGERGGYRPTSTKLYSVILHGKKTKQIETRGFHL